jgi:hypothetical protein
MKLNAKTLLLGGLAVAAAAGALKSRQKVAGLLGARASTPEAPPQPTGPRATPSPTPRPSNYDAPGPPENTATKVPAPDPVETGGIDEAAEEAAAAAEAAAIGGGTPEYAASLDEVADEEMRPVFEAGGGDSEGQEQAEALLVDNAEPAAGDRLDAEVQIDEAIEAADQPQAGEVVEPLAGVEADVEETGMTETETEEEPVAESETEEEPEATEEPALEAEDAGDEVDEVEGVPAEAFEDTPGTSELPESPDEAGEAETTPTESAEESAGTPDEDEDEDEEPASSTSAETPASEKSSAVWSSGGAPTPEEREAQQKAEQAEPLWRPPGAITTEDEPGDDDGGSEWQTWSGKAVDS